MPFNKLPIMGKNVEVALIAGTVQGSFEVEPEKWSEKRNTTKVNRKPLGLGQKEIERTELANYELSFSGAKVSEHLQVVLAVMDNLNAQGSALPEDQLSVQIIISNPNKGSKWERRTYTVCALADPNTGADDLEGNVDESFSITAKYRKLELADAPADPVNGEPNWIEVTATTLGGGAA